MVDLNKTHSRLVQLHSDLKALSDRDPEQEVTGPALPVVEAALEAAAQHLEPEDPLAQSARTLITVEQISLGTPVRAAEALLIVGQLMDALRPPPPKTTGSKAFSVDTMPQRRGTF